ncbi:hypothetical protein H1R20_g1743, partial [Candolleomyces eurysporus]
MIINSVLSAYHFGNITYPSMDPPRMGFLSTVPPNANDLMQSAQASAARFDEFPSTLNPLYIIIVPSFSIVISAIWIIY